MDIEDTSTCLSPEKGDYMINEKRKGEKVSA